MTEDENEDESEHKTEDETYKNVRNETNSSTDQDEHSISEVLSDDDETQPDTEHSIPISFPQTISLDQIHHVKVGANFNRGATRKAKVIIVDAFSATESQTTFASVVVKKLCSLLGGNWVIITCNLHNVDNCGSALIVPYK